MRLEYQIMIALALDAAAGDSRWLPHPVRGLGRLALWLEPVMRSRITSARLAGTATALVVTAVAAGAAQAVVSLCRFLHPAAAAAAGLGILFSSFGAGGTAGAGGGALGGVGWGRGPPPGAAAAAGIVILYTCFAARDLADHAGRVERALAQGDLARARRRVGLMVGRDTEALDERGVIRAVVESVAENLVDGVTAPLFFAFIGGPAGALAYKAVNTLDSTFGYRNERYREFGWASARLDDLANFIPARLTAVFLLFAAGLAGLDWRGSWRVWRRDGHKHTSPNAGHPEAAMAGPPGGEQCGATE
jgi:adenosylcobinamide-phosphate synthase